ncbi:MAG: hypothetical protein ACOZQL_40170 [Myxococcota bacterium]
MPCPAKITFDDPQQAGSGVSAPSAVEFFFSRDTSRSADDLRFPWLNNAYLAPGECTDLVGAVSTAELPAGPYFVFAVSDPDERFPDLDRTNNTAMSEEVSLLPDLAAQPIDTFLDANGLHLWLTVCNRGLVRGSGVLDLALSVDNTWSSDDQHLAVQTLTLRPGECSYMNPPVPLMAGTSPRFVTARLEPTAGEVDFNLANNTSSTAAPIDLALP